MPNSVHFRYNIYQSDYRFGVGVCVGVWFQHLYVYKHWFLVLVYVLVYSSEHGSRISPLYSPDGDCYLWKINYPPTVERCSELSSSFCYVEKSPMPSCGKLEGIKKLFHVNSFISRHEVFITTFIKK